jgi:hypothetical protein
LSELYLLVPGLTAPPPTGLGQQIPARPRIARLLTLANTSPVSGVDYESTLCALFGIDPSMQDPPVAAIRRAALGLPRDDRFWVLVEPVCLRPDQSRLLLFDTQDFDVSADELAALGRTFADHFRSDGWRIEIGEPRHWYLSPAFGAGMSSHNLGEVFGRNLDLFLPRGEGQLDWHALLNEAQMLLFSDAVNTSREAAGKMPVNGVWLSGFGRLPATVASRFQKLYAGDHLARGLAVLSGSAFDDRGPPDPDQRDGQPTLVVYDQLLRPSLRADPFAWWDQLTRFEVWLRPWLAQLRSGRIDTLRINGCDGMEFTLRRRHLLRFWRATRPLSGRTRQN